jgi:CheY-like chemotaxis protein
MWIFQGMEGHRMLTGCAVHQEQKKFLFYLALYLPKMIRKIFLADDDEDDINLFSEALNEIDSSIQFYSASNGKELLEKLRAGEDPHIIFLDINMPGMDGWEALENLKMEEAIKNIPVIMYSTAGLKLNGHKAVKSGAIAFFEKPSNFLILKEFLKQISSSPLTEIKNTLKKIGTSPVHKIYVE